MIQMLRSLSRVLLSFMLVFSLSACSSGLTAGLEPFQSNDGRYGFLYPTGWSRVNVENGPAVVFHDLINSDETLSLVISELNNEIELENLGTPEEVGERLINQLINQDNSGPKVELVNSQERDESGHVFYDLEYIAFYPETVRHELATVAVDNGNLYTFAAGTNETRWPKVKALLSRVVDSFIFLS